MTDEIFKFPSTPHLAVLGEIDIRQDKVMSELERTEFLHHELVIEEKIDGANLGITSDKSGHMITFNRGSFLHLPHSGQWKKLPEWLASREEKLFVHLSDQYILFGEWCYARHSVFYDRLPDWFLGFDIYDRENALFLSCSRRDKIFRSLEIFQVPKIACGTFTFSQVKTLLAQSRVGDHSAEGIYLRRNKGNRIEQRAKLVRPTFVQSIGNHWSRSGIQPNRLAWQK
ncbi:MAG: RNA ligase family protein [Desulfatirhabdiaceae bacterium]